MPMITKVNVKALKTSNIIVDDTTNGIIICHRGLLADSFTLRLIGLLGKSALDEDAGLLIAPSSGVHTFGMTFAIDIVVLDKRNRVIGLCEDVGAWKIRGIGLRTSSILEIPSGRIRRCGITMGDQLVIRSST